MRFESLKVHLVFCTVKHPSWSSKLEHFIQFISHSYPIHIPIISDSYPIHIPVISNSYPIYSIPNSYSISNSNPYFFPIHLQCMSKSYPIHIYLGMVQSRLQKSIARTWGCIAKLIQRAPSTPVGTTSCCPRGGTSG